MQDKTVSRTRKPARLDAGWWGRFTRYEIVDGYIRPAADATLERYRLDSELRASDGRPYETLAEVVRQGRLTVSGTVTPETAATVIHWCRQFGLLGILLQRVETVDFAPRAIPDVDPEWTGVRRSRLFRTPGGFQLEGDSNSESISETEVESVVMLHPLGSSEITREPITQTWVKFFPSIPPDQRATYSYPHPLDEHFFRIYGEPIDEFLRAARELTEPLATIAASKSAQHQDFGPFSPFANAIRQLNGLAATIGSQFWPGEDGTLHERWVAPTLIASLARMALRHLAGGMEVRVCENPTCHKLYASSAYQARYCSERCRHTVNKRAVRQNARNKRKQRTSKAVSQRRSK